MSKKSVFVSRRWPERVEAALLERYDVTINEKDVPLTADEFKLALQNYDAVLPTVTDKLDASVLNTSRIKAKILGNYGVGYSHIDEASAKAAGLVVTNTPDVLSDCTADLAITLMLMAARRAGEGERELRANQWTGWRPTHLVGTQVSGKTLGIIGFGRIGQAMARRAHHGFGMRILVQNRSAVDPAVLAKCQAEQIESVEALLPKCDFVSLHCPGGEANRHLINADRLSRMKPGSYLINTARGEVIDETALVQALKKGPLSGAALDVFDGEPKINKELLESDKLVLLPHLGSATRESREAMGFRVLENLDQFFAGKEPPDRVI